MYDTSVEGLLQDDTQLFNPYYCAWSGFLSLNALRPLKLLSCLHSLLTREEMLQRVDLEEQESDLIVIEAVEP